jgi:hypothetical protein
MPPGDQACALTTSLRPGRLPSRRLCGRAATWSRPASVVTGGSMDLVVVAVVLALAALSFVWLAFVEKA